MCKWIPGWARTAGLCGAVLILPVTAVAQSIAATVQGVIRDSSGAVLPAATVTLTNLDENTSAATTSSPLGLYEFVNLKPGRYQVAVAREGFAPVHTEEIFVGARETRRADLTLPVAGRAESVEVVAVPLVNTENGTISDSKSSEQVRRLPLNYRIRPGSTIRTLLTVPGVQSDDIDSVSVGGGLPGQVDYSVDGISATNVGAVGGTATGPVEGFAPSPETVQEFRVTSVGAGAASGQMADVTIVSRSGGNLLHGSLFWYHQNAALDAKTWNSSLKQQKVYNTFGGSFGGPLVLPGLYDGHNRTFFFGTYEGNRLPETHLYQYSVPTSAMRQGFLDGVPGPVAVDPTTGAPFPGNRIPPTSINPVARRLLDGYYRLPNVEAGTTVNNLRELGPTDSFADGFDVRMDQVIGPSQRFFVRWSRKLASGIRTSPYMNPPFQLTGGDDNVVVAHTWTPAATVSNELRFGFSGGEKFFQFPLRARDVAADLGLLGLNLANTGDVGVFPDFVFDDATGFSAIGTPRSSRQYSQTVQVTEVLSWIHEGHTLKFGGDIRRVSYQATLHQGNCCDDLGGFYFTSRSFSGNAFANLLLGLPDYTHYNVLGPDVDQYATHAGFFAQDTWRVHPRLTIEMGLRWEVHPPMREAAGNIANFDHRTGDVIIPDHGLAPSPSFLLTINACSEAPNQGACTRVLTASQAGLPQGLRRTYFGDWGPRLGFAWLAESSGKTVVRGSAGIYTQTLLGQTSNVMAGIHTSDARTYANVASDGSPLFVLPNVFPGDTPEAQPGRQNFISGTDPTLRDPRSYQWSFTLERQIPWNTLLRATYIGVQSVGMPAVVDFNQVPASTQPFSASGRPFPQWNVLRSVENLGFANYQGLQLEISRRFQNDFYFQASYVLSKNIGNAGVLPFFRPAFLPQEVFPTAVTDRFNTRYDRGNIYGSRRHRFLFTGLFPLPFGRGRAYGADWDAWVDGLLGGWELSTVTLLESGPFQTPVMAGGFDQSNTNVLGRGVQARPDRIADGNNSGGPGTIYDRSAFVSPPAGAGRFGSAGAGILEGPGLITAAAGLAKTFRLTETARFRLEATFTNLPNHPNFAVPFVDVSQPSFGRLTRVLSTEGSGNRTGQVGARIDF